MFFGQKQKILTSAKKDINGKGKGYDTMSFKDHHLGTRMLRTCIKLYLESGLKVHLRACLEWAIFLTRGVSVRELVPTPLDRLHT